MHRYYPAHSFEVQDGMSIGAFERLLSSTVGLKLIDWQRGPQPLLRMQVHTPLPKCGYSVMKKPQLEKPSYVGSMFAHHLRSEVVDIWDSMDRHAVLEGRERVIHAKYTDASGHPVEREIEHAAFEAALDRFLKGGALA